MANRHRGEIEAELGGARHTLVLTLGALAELEDAFGADDLGALTERFASGRLKARDLTRIIAAGLRGAGICRLGRNLISVGIRRADGHAKDEQNRRADHNISIWALTMSAIGT